MMGPLAILAWSVATALVLGVWVGALVERARHRRQDAAREAGLRRLMDAFAGRGRVG